MATEAIGAQGTTLSIALSDGSPTDFTLIPECKTIPGPNQKAETIDVTSLDSAGGYREFIAGFKAVDDMEVVMNYRPGDATQEAVLALFDSGLSKIYQKGYPDGATETFTAIVVGSGRPAAVGTALEVHFTLKPSGAVDFQGS